MLTNDSSLRFRGTPHAAFPLQFASSISSHESFAITPIIYIGHEGEELKTHATGFLYKRHDSTYLVTALHCLTGLDAFTARNLSRTGFRPRAIRVYPTHVGPENGWSRATLQVELYEAEYSAWRSDVNVDVYKTDMGVVKLPIPDVIKIVHINDSGNVDLLAVSGADCFVVGYPIPNFEDPYLPIWRKGSYASEPRIPIDNKPVFLVDAATSAGMSGSPIIQRWFGPAPVSSEGGLTIMASQVVTSRLVGVYGGRAHSYQEVGPIGYGWYANRIDAIIDQVQSESVFTFVKPSYNLTTKINL